MKEKIIDIAIKQMQCGGYKNLNFAHIAEELNITRANIHHHFKNKEGLALAATEQYIDAEKGAMDQIFKIHDGDLYSVLDKVEDLMIETLSVKEGKNACICSQLIYESEAPETIRDLALNRFREEQRDFEEQVRKNVNNGNLPSETDVEKFTFRIMIALHGINQVSLIVNDRETLPAKIKGSLVSII